MNTSKLYDAPIWSTSTTFNRAKNWGTTGG